MRISDAIALGRTMMRPKGRTRRHINAYDLQPEGCALGMMDMAAGNEKGELGLRTRTCRVAAPPCNCEVGAYGRVISLEVAIVHLFDEHVMGCRGNWTLDQLIDWVRTVEPQEPKETLECAEGEPRLVAVHSK